MLAGELGQPLAVGLRGGLGLLEAQQVGGQVAERHPLLLARGLLGGDLVDVGHLGEPEQLRAVADAPLERGEHGGDALAALGLGGLAGTGTEHEPGASHHDGHERQESTGHRPRQGEARTRAQEEEPGDGEEHDAGLDARLLGGERRQQHRAVDRATRRGEVAATGVELGELAAQLGEQHDLAGGALGLDAHVARGEGLGGLAERRAPRGDRGLGGDDLGLLVVDRLGRALAGRGLLVERGAGWT